MGVLVRFDRRFEIQIFRVATAGFAGAARAFELGGCARAPVTTCARKGRRGGGGRRQSVHDGPRFVSISYLSAHGPLARERERERKRDGLRVPGGRATPRRYYDASGSFVARRPVRPARPRPLRPADVGRGYENSRGFATRSADARGAWRVGVWRYRRIYDAGRIRAEATSERENGCEGEGGRVIFRWVTRISSRRARGSRQAADLPASTPPARELFAKSAAKGASRSMNDYANYYYYLHSAPTRRRRRGRTFSMYVFCLDASVIWPVKGISKMPLRDICVIGWISRINIEFFVKISEWIRMFSRQ